MWEHLVLASVDGTYLLLLQNSTKDLAFHTK